MSRSSLSVFLLRSTLLLAGLCTFSIHAGTEVTLTNSSSAALEEVVLNGGEVRFAFNGTVALSNALLVMKDTVLDASGFNITLDGGTVTRHFVITNGITLRLVNLTLKNGRFTGRTGDINEPGDPAFGGSIVNWSGRLEAVGCKFVDNQALGGRGGGNMFSSSPAYPAGGSAFGGAIYSTNGAVAITNCWFAANRCEGGLGAITAAGATQRGGDAFGGALSCTNSDLTLIGSAFTNNAAQGGATFYPGGALFLGGGTAYGGALADGGGGTLISNCVFAANEALGSMRIFSNPVELQSFGRGGALFHGDGELRVEGTLLANNSAHGGVGIESNGQRAWVDGDAEGGAVYSAGDSMFRGSAFVSNQAKGGSENGEYRLIFGMAGNGSGGAIYTKAALALVSCTLEENSAIGGDWNTELPVPPYGMGPGGSAYGGGVFAGDPGASALLVNVTLGRNYVQAGTGYNMFGPPSALGASLFNRTNVLTLTNTLLFCSSSQTNVSGAILDGGHNICSDQSASFTSSTSRNNLDPLLGSVGYYGGVTPTVPLLPASPAIDAGDDSASPPTDQRGISRPQGFASDIGAFELAPTLELSPGAVGKTRVSCLFQANRTNLFNASSNLAQWLPLGARVSDTNGVFVIEEVNMPQTPIRFYMLQPQLAP